MEFCCLYSGVSAEGASSPVVFRYLSVFASAVYLIAIVMSGIEESETPQIFRMSSVVLSMMLCISASDIFSECTKDFT